MNVRWNNMTDREKLEIVRSDGRLYVTVDGNMFDGGIDRASLMP